MRCLECGAEMQWTDAPMTEEYRGEHFTVNGIERYVCDNCGNDEMPIDAAEKLSRSLAKEYAHAHGLLSAEEIKALRNSIGLNQREFEKLLGVSSPTVSRWETGAMQQSRPVDKFMRILRDHPDALADALEMAEIHTGRTLAVTADAGAVHPATYATVSSATERHGVTLQRSDGIISSPGSSQVEVSDCKGAK